MIPHKQRKEARSRLRFLELFGHILDYSYIANEDVFFITLITGDKIELTSKEVFCFYLGYISTAKEMKGFPRMLTYMKIYDPYEFEMEDDDVML